MFEVFLAVVSLLPVGASWALCLFLMEKAREA